MTPVVPTPLTLTVQQVASGLSSPLYLTAPASDPRLFIVEQAGSIRIVKDGALLATPFLDLRSRASSGGERGLLSVAFHPSYASNGFFFVNYTDLSGNTRVERYHVSANPDVADATTAKLILGVPQPYANHNGGLVMFGSDGMLYIGMGDGGSGGDPQGNGQNLGTLLGKMLRIDVDHGDPYAIPPNNPFVSQAGARGEIWARGLRNPWRFAFDRVTGLLYIADVGQDAVEEIDVVGATESGLNFGWKIMEGSTCYGATSCARTGLTLPLVEYSHADGCSITGGFVYRGPLIQGLAGQYFYSDYCRGWLRSVKIVAGVVVERHEWAVGTLGAVQSFGEDAAGEVYILSGNGNVYRISASGR